MSGWPRSVVMLNPYAESTPSTLTGAMLPTFHMFDAPFVFPFVNHRGAMVCASGDAEAHRQLYVAAPRKVRRGWIKVHRGVAPRSTQRTGAQRMSYTLAAAAAACGLNKSTVLRAIKAGKISGTKDEHGEWTSRPPSSIASTRPLRPRRRATVRCHGTQCRRNTCGSGKQRAPCHRSRSLPSRHLNMVPRIRIRRQGSCQASAEHLQQCAEFLPLRNRGLG